MDPSVSTSSASAKSEEIRSEECHLCNKKFKNVELRNRHIRRIHKTDVLNPRTTHSHMICPLCEEETDLKNHERLQKHLEGNHQLSIEVVSSKFSSKQEFDTWKDEEKIETNYVMHRSIRKKEHKTLYFNCNRSDTKGYKPNYSKRRAKSGGTIKIKGVCPSRLICKLRDEGQVSISYWKTHAGHGNELRSKHLSKAEERMVVEKLQSGVPPNRILEDLGKLDVPKPGRLNVLTNKDITNLSRKYNIQKNQDQNDMVVAAETVQEWNSDDEVADSLGKNSIIKLQQEEINEFTREKVGVANPATDKDQAQSERSLRWANLQNFVKGLDDNNFTKFMKGIQGTVRKLQEKTTQQKSYKQKMEKREYFYSKKHSKDYKKEETDREH